MDQLPEDFMTDFPALTKLSVPVRMDLPIWYTEGGLDEEMFAQHACLDVLRGAVQAEVDAYLKAFMERSDRRFLLLLSLTTASCNVSCATCKWMAEDADMIVSSGFHGDDGGAKAANKHAGRYGE